MQSHNNHLRRSAQIHLQEENMVKLTAEEKAAAKQAKLDAKAVEKQQQADAKAAEKQLQADAKAAVKAAEETRKTELLNARGEGYNRGYTAAQKATDKAVKDAVAEVRKIADQEIKALKAEHKVALKDAVQATKAGLSVLVEKAEGKMQAEVIKDVIKVLKPALKAKGLRESYNMVKIYVDHLTQQVRK